MNQTNNVMPSAAMPPAGPADSSSPPRPPLSDDLAPSGLDEMPPPSIGVPSATLPISGQPMLTGQGLIMALGRGDAAAYGTATDSMVNAMTEMSTLQAQYATAATSGDVAAAERIAALYETTESHLVGLMVATVQATAMTGSLQGATPEQLGSIDLTVADVQTRLASAHEMYGDAPSASLDRISAALQQSAVTSDELNGMGDLWTSLTTIVANTGTVAGETMRAELGAAVQGAMFTADESLQEAIAKRATTAEEAKQEQSRKEARTKKQNDQLEAARTHERLRVQDDFLELQRLELFEERDVAHTGHVEELQSIGMAADLHSERLELARAYDEGDDIDVTRLRDDDPLPPRPRQFT